MKFDRIKPGMELLDIHAVRMGNTSMRRLGLWRVTIVSVDPVRRSAMVRWNCNPEQRWNERELAKLVTKPGKRYLEQQRKELERRAKP